MASEMLVVQRLAQRPLAAVLSITGASVLLIESRVLLWPFAAVGVVVIFLNLTEKTLHRIVSAEIFGSLVALGFTAWLLGQAYTEFIKHDQLHLLPDLYAQAVALSVAGVLVFTAGMLDFWKKSRKVR